MYECIKRISHKKIIMISIIIALVICGIICFSCSPILCILAPNIQNRNMAIKIFTYLESGEIEKLSEMFCDSAKSKATFESDLQDIFYSFNGKVTDESWEIIKKTTPFNISESIDYGKLTKMGWKTNYCDIVTTSGDSYQFFLSWYIVNDNNPEYEGIKSFTLEYTDSADDDYVGVVTDG